MKKADCGVVDEDVVAFSENTFNDRRSIDISCTDTEQ